MAQMKEQNETPKKELNEIEISSLSDAQFKTLVTRKLQELTGYFKGIKKTQEEMKVALSEIKKNLQGTNSGGDEAKNQINNLEHKEEKGIQSENQEEMLGTTLPGFRNCNPSWLRLSERPWDPKPLGRQSSSPW